MEVKHTGRGFDVIEFTDRYGDACSLQRSSLAAEDCVWLGRNEGTHVDGTCCARAHLTRGMVAALLPHLKRFVSTGEIRTEGT